MSLLSKVSGRPCSCATCATASMSKTFTSGLPSVSPYTARVVGRIARQKGFQHLVRAIQFMDRDFQIVLCAAAPDTPQLAEEMRIAVERAQAQRPGIIWIDEMVDHTVARVLDLFALGPALSPAWAGLRGAQE